MASDAHIRFRRVWLALRCCLMSAVMLGCGPDADTPPSRAPLLVLGASSLTAALRELERAYEQRHPLIDVRVSTAGSQTLQLQITNGLRADVFASADPAHLDALHRSGMTEIAQPFARNTLVIAVRNDSPLQDPTQVDRVRRLAIGSAGVPIGRYTRAALARANAEIPGFQTRFMANVVTEEPNVRLALAKVQLGQADAAVVYRTDVPSADTDQTAGTGSPADDQNPRASLRAVALPARWQVEAQYAVAQLRRAPQAAAAAAWIRWLRDETAQDILRRHGFLTRPAEAP